MLKFCIYKLSSKLADGELKSFDCDVSKTVIESFPKTYGWLKGYTIANQKYSSVKYELTNSDSTFRGDTMTSVWMPLKSYIKLKTNTYSIDKSDEWELFVLREADRINISAAVAEFICLSHSIGDFMPVPPGFNVGRSNMGRWDTWDITLTQIYRWYKDNPSSSQNINNAALETLFAHDRNKMNTVINCQKWLERFGTWDSFVKENYMESFLDKNGVPKEFFKGHSMSCPQPKTLDEFECFFQTASGCIKERGERIAAVLRGGNNSAARPQPKAQNVQKKHLIFIKKD